MKQESQKKQAYKIVKQVLVSPKGNVYMLYKFERVGFRYLYTYNWLNPTVEYKKHFSFYSVELLNGEEVDEIIIKRLTQN